MLFSCAGWIRLRMQLSNAKPMFSIGIEPVKESTDIIEGLMSKQNVILYFVYSTTTSVCAFMNNSLDELTSSGASLGIEKIFGKTTPNRFSEVSTTFSFLKLALNRMQSD